jgi:protein involved in polysaccharide export with SLBB domain
MTNFAAKIQALPDRQPRARRTATLLVALLAIGAGLTTGCTSSTRNRRAEGMMAMPPAAATSAAQSPMASASPTAGANVPPGASATTGALPVDTSTASAGGATPTPLGLIDDNSYRLAPGDLLDIKFPYHPEENERVPVRPDGRIGLQSTGDVPAAGLTPRELEASIVEKSSATLRNPVVSVVVVQLAEHKVFVGGDVSKPGFVNFRDGMTPLSAIIERGGFLDTAKTDSVLYIKRSGNQMQTTRLDLEAVIAGNAAEDIVMSPDDIIFVPKTFIGNVDVWMDQYVRGLLPTMPRPSLDLLAL